MLTRAQTSMAATRSSAVAAPRPAALVAARRCRCAVAAAAAAAAAPSSSIVSSSSKSARRPRVVAVASAGGDAATQVQAGLHELDSETFWPFLEAAAGKLTIVDFYTDWCGPCKMIYPELVKLHAELEPRGGQIVKFNCKPANKELGKELGIKVAPTFILFKGRERVAEMTGAKVDKLRELIEANL